ncbi:MAG: hypothetical protein NTY09_06765 [bacterium]|nr:hypothetical protein [bacterium]
MDSEKAKEILQQPSSRKPSELGEAVDVLYKQYGNYDAIAREVELSAGQLNNLRRVFLLPSGIRWQVDKGKIRVGQAYHISRLKEENDQWLLAFCIIESKISVKDTNAAVNSVLRHGLQLQNVLQEKVKIRFDEVKALLLPLAFEDVFKITRMAWSKKSEWADFSLKAIEEATRVDHEYIANELAKLADQLRPVSMDQNPESKDTNAGQVQNCQIHDAVCH